jgi:SAM-dependent methyltransferase
MSDDLTNLSRDSQAIWDQNADAWDAYIGEGGLFQRELLGPATERLLNVEPGQTVLDIACGNGAFSRRLAELGAAVVACDFSTVFLERAKARTVEHIDRIEYRLIDATNEAQLLTLGERRFDAAVCTMGIMDMAAIDPLFVALSRLLRPGGCFVFSVMHPCFNNGEPMVAEQIESEQGIETNFAVKISHYLTLRATKGWGITSQSMAQYYFHRPLHVLFNAAFRVGFVLDGLEEPAFKQAHESRRTINWTNYSEIPPALVARLQLI